MPTPKYSYRLNREVEAAYTKKANSQGLSTAQAIERHMRDVTGIVDEPLPIATMEADCPDCKAAPNAVCVNKYTGKPVGRPHPARIQRARELSNA